MQKYKVSFKGQNIYVGIDVHLKTWHVTTLTESGCKYSFSQHADAKELFDRLNKKFPEAHFKSAYEAGFCGFSAQCSRWDRYLGMTAAMTQVPVPTAIRVPFHC